MVVDIATGTAEHPPLRRIPSRTTSSSRRTVKKQRSTSSRKNPSRSVRRSNSSDCIPLQRSKRRSPRGPSIKRQKSATEACSFKRVRFEVDEKDRIIEHVYFSSNKRSWSSSETSRCWWTAEERAGFCADVAQLAKSLRNDKEIYDAAVHNILALCCCRNAEEKTSLTTMSLEHRKSLAVLVAGKARGLEYQVSLLLQRRRAETVQAVLVAQGQIQSKPHKALQKANLIALQYRRVSNYATHLSRMLANANELIAAPPSAATGIAPVSTTATTRPSTARRITAV